MQEHSSQTERLITLEAQFRELKENYATQLWVTNKISSIETAMTIMRATLEETARHFDRTTTQIADQLKAVFHTQDEILKAKGAQDKHLVEARIELERTLNEAKIKALQDKADDEKAERENTRWHKLVKDRYGPLVALIGGVFVVVSATAAGVSWWIVTVLSAQK